jgi:hypothetical protein
MKHMSKESFLLFHCLVTLCNTPYTVVDTKENGSREMQLPGNNERTANARVHCYRLLLLFKNLAIVRPGDSKGLSK